MSALAYCLYGVLRELERGDSDLAFRAAAQRMLFRVVEAGHGDVLASATAAVRSNVSFLVDGDGNVLSQRTLYAALAIEPSAYRDLRRHFGLRAARRGTAKVIFDIGLPPKDSGR